MINVPPDTHEINGESPECFSELSLKECCNYDIFKQALPRAYARVPEFHRKQFRTLIKGRCESFSNYAFRLGTCFKAWFDGKQAQEDMRRLKQVLLIEQFVKCLPKELHRWVIEKAPKTSFDAAKFANEHFKSEKFEGSGNQ